MDIFHKQTIATDFIKQLLSTTPLPVFKTIREGDILVPGTKYIFKNRIVELQPDSAYELKFSDTFLWEGALTPRAELYDTPHMYRTAQDRFGNWVRGTTHGLELTRVFTTNGITHDMRVGMIPVHAGDAYVATARYFLLASESEIPSSPPSIALQGATVYKLADAVEQSDGVITLDNTYFVEAENVYALDSVSQSLGDRLELVPYTDDIYRLDSAEVAQEGEILDARPRYGLRKLLQPQGDGRYFYMEPGWGETRLVTGVDMYIPTSISYSGVVSCGGDYSLELVVTEHYNDYDVSPESIGNIFPTVFDNMRYYRVASKLQVRDDFNWGAHKNNISRVFRSNSSYYDAATHKALGNYLRCLRDLHNVDLMSMYNCFDYEVSVEYKIQDMTESGYSGLRPSGIADYQNATTKIYFVPVQFNRQYTLAFDCPTPFKILPCLISSGKQVTRLNESLQNEIVDLRYGAVQFNSCSMKHPVTFTPFCLHPEHQKYERVLYLAVEVPVGNDSSFVVLEGDYTNFAQSVVDVQAVQDLPGVTESLLNVHPSLFTNDKKQHAFADILLSYLLEYTIDSRDQVVDNIERVETDLKYDRPGSYLSGGQWDIGLQYTLYSRYHEIAEKYNLDTRDVTGFVDTKMEAALRKGWMRDGR